jgi:TonB family protein
MKHIHLIFLLNILLCGSLASMSQQRQPIRVGGNVQESKLIHRVEPVYPEEAVVAGIQGVVILVVTVNERGVVTDVHVVSGHPFLIRSAVDAVSQWRYSPTYLNGEAVPVAATVTVIYKIAARLVLDELGILKDPKSGVEVDELIEQLRKSQGPVAVNPSPKAPFNLVEEKLRTLRDHGIRVAMANPLYVFHDGSLFYSIPGLATEPKLVLDREHLIDIACASGKIPTAFNLDLKVVTTLTYRLFLSGTGNLLSVQRLQGPEIPEIETELARTPIITPAFVGDDPVPAVVTVKIPIGYERINRK